MCRVCAGINPATSERNFIEKIHQLGGHVIGQYKQSHIFVKCLCPQGHECNPLPASIQQGFGMCRAQKKILLLLGQILEKG